MPLIVLLTYTGRGEAAKNFAQEMEANGIAATIRQRPGNLKYDYFQPLSQPESILLIDIWENQAALDEHHHSPQMQSILDLRAKYDLEVKAERFTTMTDAIPEIDQKYLDR